MRGSPTLAVLAATDLAVGFAIQALVLLSVGVGWQTDAYYAGQAPALVLLAIFQLPLQRAVVAAFGGSPSRHFPGGKLLLAVLAVGLALVGLMWLAASHLLQLVYPDLSADALATALIVLGVQGLAVVFTAGNLVLLSLNHLSGRFIQCEAALVASSFAAAAWVVLTVDSLGVVAAAYGQLLKAVLSGAVYLSLLHGRLTWQSPPWREVWSIVRPLSSAGMLSKLAPLVDRSIASSAVSGSLTVLVFAQTLYAACVSLAERALIAPRVPSLKSDASVARSLVVAWRLALTGVVVVAALSFGAAVALEVDLVTNAVSAPVMKLLLECLLLLAGLPIGTLSAQWMAAKMVFVGQAKLSARIMSWCFLIAIPVKLGAFELGGIRGLAIAMSCYYLASAVSLWMVLRHLSRSMQTR
jgi:hypothetical protein